MTWCLLTLQPHIFAEINLCWQRLQALLLRKHAEHVKFPIGILSTVMNSFLSSFPKLTCCLMSLGTLTYFRRLYMMCLSTCFMTLIILLSGYHSPQPMVSAHQDASNNAMSIVPISANKVTCPFQKDGTLVDLPCNKDKVISPVLCKAMGCPDVKFPGQVLPLASTPRVSSRT